MYRKRVDVLFLVAILLLSAGASGDPIPSPYSPEVSAALDTAGDNRAELEKLIAHYASGEDSLKLQAALYLVANMEGHSYVTYELRDTAGVEVAFDVLDYPDYNALKAASDTLETELGELDFERKEKAPDLQTVTADFLINQIDYSFRAWREKPWAKGYSFDDFCAYILPYRGSNEPLEPWRETFWEKYADLESKMADPIDPIEAAVLINDDIKSWFGFDPRFYYHPTDQGLSEMLQNRLGRCEDMTNVTIYAMRANGLAVTSDYTPHWANAGNNHAWNAIVSPGSQVTPFMGAESNPGKYRLANKLAKAYRKMFARQMDNLVFQDRKQDKLPRWLSGKSYKDVTADYTSVCEVTVTFEKDIPDSVDIAYLCVFNSGEWKPIHWGRIVDGAAVFADMGSDIAYLPALYVNEEVVPFAPPFILRADCDKQPLGPQHQDSVSARLISTTRRTQEVSTDGIEKSHLSDGQEYELFYWEDGWQSLGKSTAGEGPLIYEIIPAGFLYWLVAVGSDREERVFTIEDGCQVWW